MEFGFNRFRMNCINQTYYGNVLLEETRTNQKAIIQLMPSRNLTKITAFEKKNNFLTRQQPF